MRKKLFTLFIVLTTSVGTMVASYQIDGIYYNLDTNKKEASVTFDGSSYLSYDDEYIGDVVIPKTVNYNNQTYRVTSIGEYAFRGCKGLTSVIIPNSVKSIESSAFYGCKGLTSVTLPNSITYIKWCAFEGCTGLTSVTLPNSVENIYYDTFHGCTNLTSIVIPNSVKNIDDGAFQDCTGLTSLEIPNSVISIGDDAFNGCTGLTSVTIGNSVTSIGKDAFHGCTGLTSIEIPNSVTSIGGWAFAGCTGLTSVTIGQSVESVGISAFSGTGLTSIEWNAIQCGASFYQNDNHPFPSTITSIVFGPDVKKIPACICYCMYDLTSVTIGNNVTSIGAYAFYGCSGLTSIKIPDSVTSIGNEAFFACLGLPVINNLRYADTYLVGVADYDNTQSSYTIKEGTKWIGTCAFCENTNVTSVEIPNSVISIGDYAFIGCSNLKSITCKAVNPPSILYAFYEVDTSILLYVPAGSIDAYKTQYIWRNFTNIYPISAKETETTNNIQTSPTNNSVDVAFPVVTKAVCYVLIIKDSKGNIICTFTFNANGQLVSFATYAPTRNNVPQYQQEAGYVYTITGLNPGTEYSYTFTASDEAGNVLRTESGSFSTTGAQGIEEVHGKKSQSNKLLHNGQIYILRGEKVYTITGQEVR